MIIKKNWMYGGIALVAVIALWVVFGGKDYSEEDVLNINLAEHKNLAMHIHPHLTLTFNGESLAIPAGIGISEKGMRVIHTHEPDGNLHIEAPFPHQFYLGDFFTIWGKRLTNECAFEYCSDEENVLRFYVNGEESALGPDIPLYDLDKIEIVYGKRT
jgi:hypothetical protein